MEESTALIVNRINFRRGLSIMEMHNLRHRTPIWPYVLVLGCLFALALIAPRGWDHFSQDDSAKQAAIVQAPPPSDHAASENSAVVLPAQVQPAGFMTPTDTGPTLPNPLGLPVSAADQTGSTADQVGDRWQLDAAAELKNGNANSQEPVRLTPETAKSPAAEGHARVAATPMLAATQAASPAATLEPTAPVVETPSPAVLELHRDITAASEKFSAEFSRTFRAFANHSQPKAPLVSPAPINAQPLPDKPSVGTATATDLPPAATDAPPAPRAWPVPQSLLDALHALTKQDDAAVRGWVADVDGQIEHLDRLQPRDAVQAATVLKELRNSVAQGSALAAHASSMELGSQIRRVQYAMVRRLDVWDVVCSQRQATIASIPQPSQNRRRMELCLADVNTMAENNGAEGLREHLMLDTLAELAKRDDEAAADQRRHVAREVLGRIAEHRQAAGRSTAVEERTLAELDKQLRRWAAVPVESGPPEGEELLALVERYEANGRAEDGRRLAELRNELAHSAAPSDNELGRRIESHYRNANVRVALSAQLINRLLPEQKTVEAPVNDTILGSPIHGRSTTSTQLNVRLLPNPRTWQFAFEAAGNVDSQTSSTYGPVTFMNQGAAKYCVRKRILIDALGIYAEPATAAVDSNSSVAGVQTDFDSVPVVRAIVRNYALSQREQKEAQANQEAEEKIRQAACSRVDSQIAPGWRRSKKTFAIDCWRRYRSWD